MHLPHWRDATLREIVQHMRHDGCDGRPGRVELLTGIEGASSRPVADRADGRRMSLVVGLAPILYGQPARTTTRCS